MYVADWRRKPKCRGHNVKQVPGHHRRVLRCKDYATFFHRDVIAGENHALICPYSLNPTTQIRNGLPKDVVDEHVNVGGEKMLI